MHDVNYKTKSYFSVQIQCVCVCVLGVISQTKISIILFVPAG